MYFAQIEKTEARDRARGVIPTAGLGGIILEPLDIEKERSKLLKSSKTDEHRNEKPIGKIEPSVAANVAPLPKKVSDAIDSVWSVKQIWVPCRMLRNTNSR